MNHVREICNNGIHWALHEFVSCNIFIAAISREPHLMGGMVKIASMVKSNHSFSTNRGDAPFVYSFMYVLKNFESINSLSEEDKQWLRAFPIKDEMLSYYPKFLNAMMNKSITDQNVDLFIKSMIKTFNVRTSYISNAFSMLKKWKSLNNSTKETIMKSMSHTLAMNLHGSIEAKMANSSHKYYQEMNVNGAPKDTENVLKKVGFLAIIGVAAYAITKKLLGVVTGGNKAKKSWAYNKDVSPHRGYDDLFR